LRRAVKLAPDRAGSALSANPSNPGMWGDVWCWKGKAVMSRGVRAACIIFGSLVTLWGSALPWFTITYTPAGDASATRNFYFGAIDMLPYVQDISSARQFYVGIGLIFLTGIASLTGLPFIEGYLGRFFSWTQLATFIYTVYTNIINKSIIHSMNQTFLIQFYGITDANYVFKNSTLQLQQGFFLTILGLAVSFAAVNLPASEGSGGGVLQNGMIGFAALAVVSCCCLSGYDATHGLDFTRSNDLYQYDHLVSVSATKGWQDTKLSVSKGDIVFINYVPGSGLWSANKETVPPTDANGLPARAPTWLATQKGVPLPGVSSQALIGRIGSSSPFFVGNAFSWMALENGKLYLRMNQRDTSLKLTSGAIRTQITILHEDGVSYRTSTITVALSKNWQNTGLTVESSDVIGVTYVFGSGTLAGGPSVVAPDYLNAKPLNIAAITFDQNAFTTPETGTVGLLARVANGAPYYCGYSTVQRAGGDGPLTLRLANDNAALKGSVKVAVTVMTFPTVSSYYYR
jgi:hypothetical protein